MINRDLFAMARAAVEIVCEKKKVKILTRKRAVWGTSDKGEKEERGGGERTWYFSEFDFRSFTPPLKPDTLHFTPPKATWHQKF